MKKLILLVAFLVIMAGFPFTGCADEVRQFTASEDTIFSISFGEGYGCYADDFEVADGGVLVLDGYYRVDDEGNLIFEDRLLVEAGEYRIIEVERVAE